METVPYVVVALLLASVLSASGALVIVLAGDRLDAWQGYLVSLSVGAIFGGAFIHLIPHYAADFGFTHAGGLLVVAGLVGSYALEEVVHWHCHRHCDFEAYSVTLLVGDGIHNAIDGIIVASAFLAAVPVGVAATLAVMFHKVPKEIGDFGALVQGGIPRWRAVGLNVLTNLVAFVAAGAVLLLAEVEGTMAVLLPLAIGNFVFVAGADLLPEVRDDDGRSSLQLAVVVVGIVLMYAITLLE